MGMRIAIMSPWNDCCGVSVHAELIGREWMRQGHEIVVFAPTQERVGGRMPIETEDERFVYRNWEMYRYGAKVEDESSLNLYFDPSPVVNEDYDLFVIEKPCLTPLGKLLKGLRKTYDVILLMLTSHEESIRAAKDIAREYKFAIFRKEAPPTSRLYTYFHASNAILVHKNAADYLPTSSTVHLCLGSMRPILCPDNNFVEVFDGEVMKYSKLDELRGRLVDVFEGRNVQSVLSDARKYVIRNSASNIANNLMRLAQSVK